MNVTRFSPTYKTRYANKGNTIKRMERNETKRSEKKRLYYSAYQILLCKNWCLPYDYRTSTDQTDVCVIATTCLPNCFWFLFLNCSRWYPWCLLSFEGVKVKWRSKISYQILGVAIVVFAILFIWWIERTHLKVKLHNHQFNCVGDFDFTAALAVFFPLNISIPKISLWNRIIRRLKRALQSTDTTYS